MGLRTPNGRAVCCPPAALGMSQLLRHPGGTASTGTGRFSEDSIWVVVQGCSGPRPSMVHCPLSRHLENTPEKDKMKEGGK